MALFEELMLRLLLLPILAIVITIHEFAHAYTADKLGDPTAKTLGRVSLNPFVHLDLIGTLALVFFGIGWGKPVPFNPYYLKNPRRDGALIALAGPMSNLIMAVILAGIFRLGVYLNLLNLDLVFQILYTLIWLNILLAIFNLLPFDPLDGFKVVLGFLPESLAYDWLETSKYGIIVILFLLITNLFEIIIFSPAKFILNLLI